MKFLFCLLLLTLAVCDQNDNHCTTPPPPNSNCQFPADQLAILSQRSRFTFNLDKYIRGWISESTFVTLISPIISNSFTQAVIQTPLGNTGPFVGKSAFIAWLVSLPNTTFAGFSDHRLMNFIFDPIGNPCNPSEISQQNYSPNLLLIKAGNGSLLSWEVSTEQMNWVPGPIASYPPTWLINSYLVNSTALLDVESLNIDLYGPLARSLRSR